MMKTSEDQKCNWKLHEIGYNDIKDQFVFEYKVGCALDYRFCVFGQEMTSFRKMNKCEYCGKEADVSHYGTWEQRNV